MSVVSRSRIADLGREIGPESLAGVQALYDAEQRALAGSFPATAADIAYGDDPRQRLDVYRPLDAATPAPVVVWVHGGGFMRGDKGDAERWPNAHAGRVFARAGFVGIVINYRLAPDDGWPAGAEDMAAVIDWTQAHAAEFGGDPSKVVLAGTSAGAAHVASLFQLLPDADIRGAILLSGLYGIEPYSDARDRSYYGEDAALHPERAPLTALVETAISLFVAGAEFDPPRFQAEFVGLLQQRLARHGRLPRSYIGSGHNHFSLAYHLGTTDTRLADELTSFVVDVTS